MDTTRRFGGIGRLYGPAAQRAIAEAGFTVVGVGGVGSWAVEALVRSGALDLTLIDGDNVVESNANRQLQALDGNWGKAKIRALAERAALIDPDCRIRLLEEMVDRDNRSDLIPERSVVLECVDQAAAKAAIIALARGRGQPIVSSGAAGGRRDPGRLRRDDLALARGDPLAAATRQHLRHDYGFPAGGGRRVRRFGVDVVYSDEPIVRPSSRDCPGSDPSAGLSCSGYGSVMTVTATMGLMMAAAALELAAAGAA